MGHYSLETSTKPDFPEQLSKDELELTLNDCQEIINAYDTNHDGSLQFDEFLNIFVPFDQKDFQNKYLNGEDMKHY